MIKNVLKYFLQTKNLLKVSKGNRFIFVFHDISSVTSIQHSPDYSTEIETFNKQIKLLSDIFEIIPIDDIVANKKLSKRKNYASITFDDGFLSILNTAHPILYEKNIPYSIFLNGSAILKNQLWVTNLTIHQNDEKYKEKLFNYTSIKTGYPSNALSQIVTKGLFNQEEEEDIPYPSHQSNEKIFLDEIDVSFLLDKGVTVGSHSYDHFVLKNCSETVLVKQIKSNNETLTKIVKALPKHFALPFGKKEHYNKQTINQLRIQGHQFIYSTNPNKFGVKDLDTFNFIFPRIGITNESENQLLFFINRAILRKINL